MHKQRKLIERAEGLSQFLISELSFLFVVNSGCTEKRMMKG